MAVANWRWSSVARHPIWLWLVAGIASLWPIVPSVLSWGDLTPGQTGMVGASEFHRWAHGEIGAGRPVLDAPWVYPFGAWIFILPMYVIGTMGTAIKVWMVATAFLNLYVLVELDKHGRRGLRASWFWVLFVWGTGASAVSQMESFIAPLLVLCAMWWFTAPRRTGAALALLGWVKLFPFLWLVPLIALGDRRVARRVVNSAGLAAALVAALGLVLGSGRNLLSFMSSQFDRGLQIESFWALPIQVARIFGREEVSTLDRVTRTLEFESATGNSWAAVASIALPVLVLIVLLVFARSAWLTRRSDFASKGDLAAAGLLALMTALVLGNKVGSPQYILWFAPAIAFGILHGRSRTVTTWWPLIALGLAVLTQIQYPLFYSSVHEGELPGVAALLGRHALTLVLFVWSCVVLWQAKATEPDDSTGHEQPVAELEPDGGDHREVPEGDHQS